MRIARYTRLARYTLPRCWVLQRSTCLYLSLSVSICLYLSLPVSTCLYQAKERALLHAYYGPHNQELYALIGRDMGWEQMASPDAGQS